MLDYFPVALVFALLVTGLGAVLYSLGRSEVTSMTERWALITVFSPAFFVFLSLIPIAQGNGKLAAITLMFGLGLISLVVFFLAEGVTAVFGRVQAKAGPWKLLLYPLTFKSGLQMSTLIFATVGIGFFLIFVAN